MSNHFLCSLCKQVTDVLDMIPLTCKTHTNSQKKPYRCVRENVRCNRFKVVSNSFDIQTMVSPVHATNFDRVSLIYNNDKMTGKLLILKSRTADP